VADDDEFPDEEPVDPDPPWRQYEDQIFDRLQEKAGDDAVVEPNQKLPGRLSAVPRQIDIVVRGSFAGLPEMLVVVDCKCWARPVTVTDVEKLVGLVEDVDASMGVLITNAGASKAAFRRGGRSVQVEVVPFDDLARWVERLPTVAHTMGTDTATLSYYDGSHWHTELVDAEFAEAVLRRLEIRARRRVPRQARRVDTPASPPAPATRHRKRPVRRRHR
jgi:hypothetical protein